jgi:hypothetical protein
MLPQGGRDLEPGVAGANDQNSFLGHGLKDVWDEKSFFGILQPSLAIVTTRQIGFKCRGYSDLRLGND